MDKITEKFKEINQSLKILTKAPGFINAQQVINNVISLLGIEEDISWKLFSDSQGKIRSNAFWFMEAKGFADKRATYKIAESNNKNIDLKAYWMKNISKSIISWLVALTPNFEDEPFYKKLNIGIDFIIPELADRIKIVLSDKYIIRTLELHEYLSVTQQTILSKWFQGFDFKNKDYVHNVLWQSFDLKPVNKKFFLEISQFFVELKQYLSEDIKIFDDKHAGYFTNRLLGRIIFCWFLDKKGFINPEIKYFDTDNLISSKYYKDKLELLFFKVFNTPIEEREQGIDNITPFLNGGLFEVKENDKFKDPKLDFPKDYFDRLYNFLRQYNFTTDESTSTFQQVAIDPEMLGRILENLLAEQIEESGEQARKAKGAYYTPREIVDYMCRESLREYLKTNIEETEDRDQRISQLLDSKLHEFRDQQRNYKQDLSPYKNDIINALDELKVIDPACGSGAFPMGMLQLLLLCYERLEPRFDPYKTKLNIIKNNLYGVDIEPMAVEISRLRAWLSIIVDEVANSTKIEPLPNLDFKFICANSLIPLKKDSANIFDSINEDDLIRLRDNYFSARNSKDKELIRKEYDKLISFKENNSNFSSEYERQLKTYHPFNSENISEFFDSTFMFGVKEGFDVIIANPPYVSNKGVNTELQNKYKEIYKISDDLYNYFFQKSFLISKNFGIITFISSDTYLTIQTKINLRELFQDNHIIELIKTDNVFEEQMVEPVIIIVKKEDTRKIDYSFIFKNAKNSFDNPKLYSTNISIYRKVSNKVFFPPTELNIKIYEKYNKIVCKLINKWWDSISTSKNIFKNAAILKAYRQTLEPGDITLLGLITEGGVGLQTGDNGKYIGVIKGSKAAENVIKTRSKKLYEAIIKLNIKELKHLTSKDQVYKYLSSLAEMQIRNLFDDLKEKHGRDIFGQGYIYKIIDKSEIAEINNLSEDEKTNGIDLKKPHFVLYDKGDKEGNRWFLETPFYIDWSKQSVSILQTDTKARWQGYQFFFKEGFCWILTLNESSIYQKSRIKEPGIHDVNAMTLVPNCDTITTKYLICLFNSYFIYHFKFNFLNSSSAFQINDARQFPIIIPTKEQLQEFELIFNSAHEIKKNQFSNIISKSYAEKRLEEIQKDLDKKVYKLYGI